ncbi:MAG: hypothetical protein J6K48_14565 [Lachnospiraceae bacterium]|nr:hypothetical protein [Lachnospiraceae bacterium]
MITKCMGIREAFLYNIIAAEKIRGKDMFGFLHGAGKNKQLDEIIQRVEMNVSNNYKDAAQDGLKEFEEVLQRLEAAGKIKEKQKQYYERKLSAFKEQMINFTHKDQKPTWV